MADPMTATELRANLYRVIDEVLETGRPQRVRRGDQFVLISPEEPRVRLRLEDLPRRDAIACSPDELVEQSFADAWTPDP